MKILRIILFLIIVIVITQLVTFNFIAKQEIIDKLLDERFTNNLQFSDTFYVKYNEFDRWLIENSWMDYWPLELEGDKEELKKRLNTNELIFEDQSASLNNTDKKNRIIYPNQYIVFATVGELENISTLFECRIHEHLFTKDKYKSHHKSYRWILFGWIELLNRNKIEPAANTI